MLADPAAVRRFADANERSADALDAVEVPTIAGWKGVASNMYRERAAAVTERRAQLSKAHRTAAEHLGIFATEAQALLADMHTFERQQLAAIEDIHRVDARIASAVDITTADRLAGDRAVCDRRRIAAQHGFNTALAEVTAAETRCADRIARLARVEPLQTLTERLEVLPLAEFIAYKSLIEDGRLPKEGLNWTSDGCSDHGIATGDVGLPACQLHDFDYRNFEKTRDDYFTDKLKADQRLHDELVRNAIEDAKPRSVFGWMTVGATAPLILANGLERAEVVYLGVTVGGWPDNTQKDDTVGTKGKKGKSKRKSQLAPGPLNQKGNAPQRVLS